MMLSGVSSYMYMYMLFLVIYMHHSWAHTTMTWTANSDMEYRRLPTNISVSQTPSAVSCAIECATAHSCMSFSYHSGYNTCVLYSVLSTVDTIEEISEQGWTSYDIRSEMCPSLLGFIYKRDMNMCYHLESEKVMNATDAILFCSSMNGRMLRINTNEKQVFIAELLSSISSKSVYIGGVSKNKDDMFSYEDGSPLTFFQWNPDSPDGELAIKMKKADNFTWDNASGFSRKPFLCEIAL